MLVLIMAVFNTNNQELTEDLYIKINHKITRISKYLPIKLEDLEDD